MPRSVLLWGFIMGNNDDIKYMQQALDLSLKGSGFVNPNPMVGAVIVQNGKVIGEGYHQRYGEAHAEINAINSAMGKIRDATLYVTMEPCNHQGKTPPCTERIIEERMGRVVIGMKDPNPNVLGNGLQRIEQAGIAVTSGILKTNISKVNEIFTKYAQAQIPFCVLKTAMTLDGKIATYSGASKWISNEKSRHHVHALRRKYAAIMVGVNTVIKDNPELTDRSDNALKCHPVRVVVDSKGRTPIRSKVLDTRLARTIIAVTKNAPDKQINTLIKKGVEVIKCPEKEGKVNLSYLIKVLGKQNIDSILLEGGSQLNFSALREGIIDKVYSFISPKMIGGDKAITPVGGDGFEKIEDAITLNIDQISRFDEDILIEAYIIGK